MAAKKDIRTAHEKWEQTMADARARGYLFKQALPEGLLGGWDYTKKPNRRNHSDTSPVELRSRGRVPPNFRDDSEDKLSFTVTTYMPLPNKDADQTKTRLNDIQGLPEPKHKIPTNLSDFKREMKRKDGMLENFHFVGGPRWKEWCAWDEEYLLWGRFRDHGLEYKGFQPAWDSKPLMDLGYQKVHEDMERLAYEQGVPSWTILMLEDFATEQAAFRQRFDNFLEQYSPSIPRSLTMLRQGSFYYYIKDNPTPDQHEHTQYQQMDRVFPKILLRQSGYQKWVEQLYYHIGFQQTENIGKSNLVAENGLGACLLDNVCVPPQCQYAGVRKPAASHFLNPSETITLPPHNGMSYSRHNSDAKSSHFTPTHLPEETIGPSRFLIEYEDRQFAVPDGRQDAAHPSSIQTTPEQRMYSSKLFSNSGLQTNETIQPADYLNTDRSSPFDANATFRDEISESGTPPHDELYRGELEDLAFPSRNMLGSIGSGRRGQHTPVGFHSRYGLFRREDTRA